MHPLAHEAVKAALNCDWDSAVSLNKKILHDDSEDISALLRLSNALLETGHVKDAQKYAKKAQKIDPTAPLVRKCLERCSSPLEKSDIQVQQALLDICKNNSYGVDIIMPSLIRKSAKPHCSMLFDSILIGSDGNFSPCCHIPTDIKYGNSFENPDEYNIGESQKLRNKFLEASSAEQLPETCRSCPRLDPAPRLDPHYDH